MTEQDLIHHLHHDQGMSLRDWFAGQAMVAAADRIEALEAENGVLRTEKHADAEAIAALEARADALVEKLEWAVETLKGAEIYIRSDADHIAAQDGEDCLEYRVAMDCLDPICAFLAAIQEKTNDHRTD